MNEGIDSQLARMRQYFQSGATLPVDFRKKQLKNLQAALKKFEAEIFEALRSDLNKQPEESWVTEIGFVHAEISHTLKHLHQWMKPERVSTNLLNFPSRSRLYKDPLGVVLVIGPWNYPLQLLLAPVIGAIAAGNAVVMKPGEFSPATAAVVTKLISETFAPEYILCVNGEGATVVPRLMDAFRFDHVFFTGSTHVGKSIYAKAAEKLIPVTLELGGKSPCIVEADANIRIAAKRIALTKFSNAGQMCVSPDYLLVHEDVRAQLEKELQHWILKFYGGEHEKDFGRIVNEPAMKRLSGYLKQGRVVAGGEVDHEKKTIGPTLIADVDPDSPIMQEEIFGPLLPVISFRSFEEAKAIVARNPDPLAFYLFTESAEIEKRWMKEVSFGGGCINNAAWHLTNYHLPFGGRGNSGIGAYHGKYSFDTFSHRKAVMKTPTWFDPSIKYPPFKGKLNLFKKIIR